MDFSGQWNFVNHSVRVQIVAQRKQKSINASFLLPIPYEKSNPTTLKHKGLCTLIETEEAPRLNQ